MLTALAFLPITLQSKPLPSPTEASMARLEKRLAAYCDRFQGRLGYCLKVIPTGTVIGFRMNERFPTASTIKTGIMVEAVNRVDEGTLKWSDKRPVPPDSGRQASMWSYFFKDGTSPDLDGWVNLMIGVSDNTATIVLREWLSIEAINARLEKLGLPNTKVLGTVDPSKVQLYRLRQMFGLGVTTPREMNRLLELILTGKAASSAGCERMLKILGRQYWDDALGSTVPPTVRIFHKTGAINRSRSDTAIILGPTPYILTIYTDNQKDQRWAPDNAGDLALRQIGDWVWAALEPTMPYRRPNKWEQFAPTGGGA